MNKYKVCVYAICKNEEQFANRWINSMKEADEIYVLDTGSTDNTIKILKENNVIVKQKKIIPWRFDIARNLSLDMIPKDCDICVCTDLDEVFNKGWRKSLEQIWDKNTNLLQYNYNWSKDVNFYIGKIHQRNDYKWINLVHEILKYQKTNEQIKTTDNITLNHYPDNNKSRSSYLPLLELAVQEDPTNDRNMHYLGREYMYHNQNNKAIKTLKKHLKLESATWKDERSASYRFIARCYYRKEKIKEAIKNYDKAINEASHLRDPYVEKALLMFNEKDYNNVIYLCNKALDITNKYKSYINEPFSYDHTIYDLLSLSYYYKNDMYLAKYYINKALEISPNNKRLQDNKKIFN